MFENSDKSTGYHQSWQLFFPLEKLEIQHVELFNSKLDSIFLEEDVEDPGLRLQLVWDLHHRLQYGSSLFGIHSNILGSSLLVLLSRALFASFLIKIYFNLDCAYKRSISELLSLFPV